MFRDRRAISLLARISQNSSWFDLCDNNLSEKKWWGTDPLNLRLNWKVCDGDSREVEPTSVMQYVRWTSTRIIFELLIVLDLDLCADQPCVGNSTCYNVFGGDYVCKCPETMETTNKNCSIGS